MEMRPSGSLPIGQQHFAVLLDKIAKLEKRVFQLENTTPDYIELVERTGNPVTPPTGRCRIFIKDVAGAARVHQIDDTGSASPL